MGPRPADLAAEQQVAGAEPVVEQIADVPRRVAGRPQRLQGPAPQRRDVAADRIGGAGHPLGGIRPQCGAGPGEQTRRAAEMIGVPVRDQDVTHPQVALLGRVGDLVGPEARIDDRGVAAAAVSQQVLEVAVAAQLQLEDDVVVAGEIGDRHRRLLQMPRTMPTVRPTQVSRSPADSTSARLGVLQQPGVGGVGLVVQTHVQPAPPRRVSHGVPQAEPRPAAPVRQLAHERAALVEPVVAPEQRPAPPHRPHVIAAAQADDEIGAPARRHQEIAAEFDRVVRRAAVARQILEGVGQVSDGGLQAERGHEVPAQGQPEREGALEHVREVVAEPCRGMLDPQIHHEQPAAVRLFGLRSAIRRTRPAGSVRGRVRRLLRRRRQRDLGPHRRGADGRLRRRHGLAGVDPAAPRVPDLARHVALAHRAGGIADDRQPRREAAADAGNEHRPAQAGHVGEQAPPRGLRCGDGVADRRMERHHAAVGGQGGERPEQQQEQHGPVHRHLTDRSRPCRSGPHHVVLPGPSPPADPAAKIGKKP